MLEAIRVLDLSRVLPGHYASLILADMGAQVIKIEDTKKVDYLRSYEPRVNRESAFFLAVNRNKRSIRLNLTEPKGKEVFMRLAAQCDIIIENFRSGVVEALGIDYDQVRKVNPGIIYCSISGFGQNGLYRDRGAMILTLSA